MAKLMKKHIITIIAASLIVIGVVVTIVVVVTRNSKKNDDKEEPEILTVIKSNAELVRPNVRLNAEMELVKMGNNMTGIIISDPYASLFYLNFKINYGCFIDTIPGITHLGEHMSFQSNEKYNYLYPLFNSFFEIKDSWFAGGTAGTFQGYEIGLPFNLVADKLMDMLTEAFRYPLFSPELIKNELQAINHEFYVNYRYKRLEFDLVSQLSSNKTGFNGMVCGNNETLKPSESEKLSKILKGYHMVIKNPGNIFFTLYSNKTMNESEEIAKKYLNYKMHVFPDNEIDLEDKKKLEQNMVNIVKEEIFDNNLYKHGLYINSISKSNILSIYYYLGKVETKKLNFNLVTYIYYLLNSKSLMKILRDKNYIIMDYRFEVLGDIGDILMDNNIYFKIVFFLTETGINNINEILIIINKYIDIIKEEGCERKYFNDFVKYVNNKIILNFNKQEFFSPNSFLQIGFNYIYCEPDKILIDGKLTEDNYNKELLKKHLELIKFEKSFYTLNSQKAINELDLSTILKNPKGGKLKYFKADYIKGEIPDDIVKNISDTSIKIEGLKIREISPYLSAKYKDVVIPCYKEKENKCKEKNEFDYENEDKYNGTKYEESDEHHETFYQIDKSSESHLVYSKLNIEFHLDQMNNDDIKSALLLEQYYMKYLFSEFLEIPEILSTNLNPEKMLLDFNFKTFSDNTEIIITKLIQLFTSSPKKENFDYVKLIALEDLRKQKDITFDVYIKNIFFKIKFNYTDLDDIDKKIAGINSIDFFRFSYAHSELLLPGIKKIKFHIAGNINETLVKNIHNYIKEKIPINNIRLLLEESFIKDEKDFPYVNNYYHQVKMDSVNNGLFVAYEFQENYTKYIEIFRACFHVIAINYLRFNYSNVYSPKILIQKNFLCVLEQGLYKEVDQMEDDLNKVLLDVFEGKINVNNYKEIAESYTTQEKAKKEKTLDNLFDEFVKTYQDNNIVNIDNFKAPETFKELVDIIAPIFREPNRTTVLITRNNLSEEDFKKMFERRSKIKQYILNNNITINHTIFNNS